MRVYSARNVVEENALLFDRALADQALAGGDLIGLARAPGIARQQPQRRLFSRLGFHLVNRALLRLDQRGEFREQHLADGEQVALALQHARELRQVRLQPVLFLVPLGRGPQIVDHRVDVVLQFRHFAARLDLDGPG